MAAALWKDRGLAAARTGDGRGRVQGGRVVDWRWVRMGRRCEKDAVSFF
jgi:hypothetical protein